MTLAGEGPLTGDHAVRPVASTPCSKVNELRAHLAANARGRGTRGDYLPRRDTGDHLQVIAVANFKGGSGKTTTSVHLAQYLALHGYRVLALDLDPQASLSALFGVMPEIHVRANETLYAAIRYDEQRRPLLPRHSADLLRRPRSRSREPRTDGV